MKMSWRRDKTPGWAALDLKQQQKEVFELEVDNDPYPPMSRAITPLRPCQNFLQNNDHPAKSLSSLLPPVKFPTLKDDEDRKKLPVVGNSSANQSNSFTNETKIVQAYAKWKELHSWADESLIEDIMAAVDNDVSKASALLIEMVSFESFEQNKDRNIGESKSNSEHSHLDHKNSVALKGDLKSLSSLLPPVKFPTLKDDEDRKKLPVVGNSGATQSNSFTNETEIVQAYAKLKELHSRADESLIEDIMVAVDNDVSKALALLIPMVSFESFEQNKDRNIGESKSNSEHSPLDHKNSVALKGDLFGEFTDFAELSRVIEDCLNHKNEELTNKNASFGFKHSHDDAALMKPILGHLRSVPVEPEWAEDDIYLIHRKDAIRMTRSASQHSRAATDAYLRGDHFSAQQFSVKAREERMAAQRLNAKAAKEILSITNSKNDLWKLDLHGLHAAEAVQALQERLQKVESLVPLDRFVSPNRDSEGAGIMRSAFPESFCCIRTENLNEQHAASRQRPTLLHVITGRGNHSRGQAALPIAVRNFLNENGYLYDEARPGLITVRPKFPRY